MKGYRDAVVIIQTWSFSGWLWQDVGEGGGKAETEGWPIESISTGIESLPGETLGGDTYSKSSSGSQMRGGGSASIGAKE